MSAAALAGTVPAFEIFAPAIARAALKPEKEDLKFGFIKLTDMAPLAIAKEIGYFEDEGLYVTLEPQANWKVLLDRVITGELDGAHMLAGQPLGATIGFGTKAHIITPFSMDLNGNGITVSNAVWEEMKKHIPDGPDGKPVHPIKADALKPVVDKYKAEGKPFNMGMVFPRLDAQLRAALLARRRRHQSRLLFADRHHRPDHGRRAAVGDAAAANAGDAAKPARSSAIASASRGTSRRCSRASACRSSPTTRSGRTIRKRCSASPPTSRPKNPEHRARRSPRR